MDGRPDGEAPTPARQRRGRATKRRWNNGRKAGTKTHEQRRRQLEVERRGAGSKERPTSAKYTKKTRGSRQQAATRRGGSRNRMRTTPKRCHRGTPGASSLGWRHGHSNAARQTAKGITGGGLTWGSAMSECGKQPRGREVEARQSENRRDTLTAAWMDGRTEKRQRRQDSGEGEQPREGGTMEGKQAPRRTSSGGGNSR